MCRVMILSFCSSLITGMPKVNLWIVRNFISTRNSIQSVLPCIILHITICRIKIDILILFGWLSMVYEPRKIYRRRILNPACDFVPRPKQLPDVVLLMVPNWILLCPFQCFETWHQEEIPEIVLKGHAQNIYWKLL